MMSASIVVLPRNSARASSSQRQRRAPFYTITIVLTAILALSGFVAAPAWAQLSIEGMQPVPPDINVPTEPLSVGNVTAGILNIGASGTVNAANVGVGTNNGEGTVSISGGGSLTTSGALFIGTAPSPIATNQSGVGTLGNVTVSGTGSGLTASSISVGASDSSVRRQCDSSTRNRHGHR
jgi:hypothetical protein